MFRVLTFFADLYRDRQPRSSLTKRPLALNLPVEVLALRSDIAHAIIGFALPLTAGSLFLATSHGPALLKRPGRCAKVQQEWAGAVIAKLWACSRSRKKFEWSLASFSQPLQIYFTRAGVRQVYLFSHLRTRFSISSKGSNLPEPILNYRGHRRAGSTPSTVTVSKGGPSTMGSFTCTLCRFRPLRPTTRSFASSANRKAIPPESPNFVDVPTSFQPDLYVPRRLKGKLPVPRELFPVQRPDKPSPQYIENVTPDMKPENMTPASRQTPLGQHRSRMSSLRKQHLRSSLVDLHARKQYIIRQIDARSTAKLEESERLRHQPIREDERLTNVSTPTAMLPRKTTLYTEENAEAIWNSKQENVLRQQDKRDSMNSYALHSLYMNARNFVTTEEQLLAEIEKKFLPGGRNAEFRRSDFAETGDNIWVKGVPSTVKDLISESSSQTPRNGQPPPPSDVKTKYRKDQERMQRIAEELTGGKI